MANKSYSIVLFLLLFLFGIFSEGRAVEVPIFVENPRAKDNPGVMRENEPVVGGVPLPPGQVWDIKNLCLIDEDQHPVPAQVSPMVRYQDGSLHWVLLNFLADMKAGESLSYRLIDRSQHADAANPVVTKEDSNTVTLSNGILEVRVRRANFDGISYVSLDGEKVLESGGRPGVKMADNRKLIAGDPDHLSFEYQGPIRTTLCLKGAYKDYDSGKDIPGFGYTLRLTLFANSSILKVEHLLKNSRSDKGQHLHIRKAWMNIKTMGRGKVDIQGPSLNYSSSDGNAFLHIWHEGAFKNTLPCLEAIDGNLGVNFIPEMNEHVDQSKAGTYYTNLDEGGTAYWLSDMSFKGTEIYMAFSKDSFKKWKDWSFRAKEFLHARCPSEWYAKYDGLGVGLFGCLEDEIETYKRWGWRGWQKENKQPWGKLGLIDFHKQYLHVHDVSEGDQVRGLTVQYARTGGREFLDRAGAWADYMKYHYAPRTEDFKVHDTVMSWKGWFWEKGRPLEGSTPGMVHWLNNGRADACHDYGAGLGNYYLLTGDKEALAALEDLCEKYWDEYANAVPGKYETNPWGMRGIGRHLCITSRAYSILGTEEMKKLMALIARLILEDSNRDERGFIRKTKWLAKFKPLLDSEKCPEAIRKLVSEKGIKVDRQGNPYSHDEGSWKLTEIAPWQQAIVAMGMYDYYKLSGDEDARDFLVAFAEAMLKYCVSKVCGHVYYNTVIGFPTKDSSCNPQRGYWDWTNHCKPGKPAAHDGWYTRRLVNSLVIGYQLSGRKHLIDAAKRLWNKGSKVDWWTLPKAADDEVYRFAQIDWGTKDDDISSASLLFYEYGNPKKDVVPPEVVEDLKAESVGSGQVELSWTAPSDNEGKMAVYQIKYSELPIKSYRDFNFALDEGKARNWNRAENVKGEPVPGEAGKSESMKIIGLKPGKWLFAIRSYDGHMNQSGISNIAGVSVR